MVTLSSPTLQGLLTNVRIILNSRDPNNSFWKDDELSMYINDAIRLYFLECVQDNEGYFTTTADLNITANTETVALPGDCFEIRTLYKKVTNGYIPLSYRNIVNEGYTTQGGTSSEAYLPYYYFRGNSIVLRPTPNFSETSGLRLEYLQFPQEMVYGGDSMTNQVSPVFKELIISYAVAQAKWKESLVNGVDLYTMCERKLGNVYKVFKDAIVKRSKYPSYTQPFNPETES